MIPTSTGSPVSSDRLPEDMPSAKTVVFNIKVTPLPVECPCKTYIGDCAYCLGRGVSSFFEASIIFGAGTCLMLVEDGEENLYLPCDFPEKTDRPSCCVVVVESYLKEHVDERNASPS